MQLRQKNGTPVWVLFNSVIITDGPDGVPMVQATAIDISQRKKAEEALQVSENHFRLLVEQASDGIFIANAEGKYLDVNSAGADMLGHTRDEILQLSLPEFCCRRASAACGPGCPFHRRCYGTKRMDISTSGWLFLSGGSFRETAARWTFAGNSSRHKRTAGLRGSNAQE